jgi:hypothetical protein
MASCLVHLYRRSVVKALLCQIVVNAAQDNSLYLLELQLGGSANFTRLFPSKPSEFSDLDGQSWCTVQEL